MKLVWIGLGLVLLGLAISSLGLQRRPKFIRNYEEAEYAREIPFREPDSVVDGLAVYSVGEGDPVLLFPYPHGHTSRPMAQEALAEALAAMGRRVVTFDVPGAYRSSRDPVGDMDEMLDCADETLARLGIDGPVDVFGHSMSGLAALAYAIERPARVERLVLIGSVSGFPAAARWGLPGSAFQISDPNYWRVILWGMRVNSGRGDLKLHKQLQNLMESSAYYDRRHFTPLEIEPEDATQGVPIRMIWTENMYRRLSYADRLGEVRAETLVLVGRYDTYTPLPCSQELAAGIPEAQLAIFETSGHAPFVEEEALFEEIVDDFLTDQIEEGIELTK